MPERRWTRSAGCSMFVLWGLLATGTAWGQFPDLTIVDIDITPSNPAAGQTVQVQVTAVNAGTAMPAVDTQMHLWVDQAGVPAACTSASQVQFLEIAFPVETQRIFTFDVVYNTPGAYRLFAWVDCVNVIPEFDENNNTQALDITVGLGDLTIDSIAPTVPDPAPGQPVMLDVTVRNTGPAIEALWRCGVSYSATEPTTCTFNQTLQRIAFHRTRRTRCSLAR